MYKSCLNSYAVVIKKIINFYKVKIKQSGVRTQSNSSKHLGSNRAQSIERSVIEPMHTTPEEFENAALFLRPVKPSAHTAGPSQERSLKKTLLKPEEFPWKSRLCILVQVETIWKTKLFENDYQHTSLPKFSSDKNCPVIVSCVF